jgi:HK97 family phage prohead protease
MSTRNADVLELRHGGGDLTVDNSRIRGYAIVFESLSEDLGGFRERILPSAVDRTLREALDVRALVDHDSAKVIGRTRAGTLTLRKDRNGLKVEIDPPNTTAARDIVESVQRGDVSGMSFAFRTLEDDWHMEDGMPIRDVIDMKIREISIVSFPAYGATSVDVAKRSLDDFLVTLTPGKYSKEYWHKRLRNVLAQ